MSSRIVLLAPPYQHTPGPFASLTHFAEPPLGLAHLASSLTASGFDGVVEILDGQGLGWDPHRLTKETIHRNPDVVGISTTTLTADVSRQICRDIKRELPDCRVIVGGPHPSALPEDLLPDADIAVIGEGETAFVNLVSTRNLNKVDGIAYIDSGEIRINEPGSLIVDLDTLPLPAYELLPMDRYRYPYPIRKAPGRYSTIMTSRGCVGRCRFCAKPAIWGKGVRYCSPDRVLDDLDKLVGEQNVTLLYFYDDSFTSKPERAAKIAQEILRKNWPLKWICQSRADELDDSLCRELAAGGCVKIEIGVECGDSDLREEAAKAIDDEQIRKSFKCAHEAGIQTKANFIFGFPGETEKTIQEAISLALELDATYVNFFHMVPFPGSRYYDIYREKGWLRTQSWSRFGYHGKPLVSVPGADGTLLDQARKQALFRFYFRPSKLIQIIRNLIWSRNFQTGFQGFLALVNGVVGRFSPGSGK